jgi:hypothetical protein
VNLNRDCGTGCGPLGSSLNALTSTPNVAASLPKPFGALLVEAVSDADNNVELDVRQHIAVLRFTSGYGNCAMYAKNVGSARG